MVVGMGGSDSKLNFRKAVVQLTTKKTVREIIAMCFFSDGMLVFEVLRIRQSMAAADPPDNQLNEDNKLWILFRP